MSGVQVAVGGAPSVLHPPRGRHHHPCEQMFAPAVAGVKPLSLSQVVALLGADVLMTPMDGVGGWQQRVTIPLSDCSPWHPCPLCPLYLLNPVSLLSWSNERVPPLG